MYIDDFLEYLKKKLKKSDNTIEAYTRDVMEFSKFVEGRGVKDLKDVRNTEVVAYMLELKNKSSVLFLFRRC